MPDHAHQRIFPVVDVVEVRRIFSTGNMLRRGKIHHGIGRIVGQRDKAPEKLHIPLVLVLQQIILLALSHDDGRQIGAFLVLHHELTSLLCDRPAPAVALAQLGIGAFHKAACAWNGGDDSRHLLIQKEFQQLARHIDDLLLCKVADHHADHRPGILRHVCHLADFKMQQPRSEIDVGHAVEKCAASGLHRILRQPCGDPVGILPAMCRIGRRTNHLHQLRVIRHILRFHIGVGNVPEQRTILHNTFRDLATRNTMIIVQNLLFGNSETLR